MKILSIFALSVIACSGVDSSNTDSATQVMQRDQDLRISGYLIQHGFDLSKVVFEEELVRLEEDSSTTRAALLYAIELDSEYTEKAYWYSVLDARSHTPVNKLTNAGRIQYHFDSSVSEAWRAQFRSAANAWSAASDCLRMTECPTCTLTTQSQNVIFIQVGEAGVASDGSPAGARGSFPAVTRTAGVLVGHATIIDFDVANSTNATYMLRTALHELGHNIGLTHPNDGHVLIPGTAASSTGCCISTYPTVMDYSNGPAALQPDDLTAIRLLYHTVTQPRGGTTCG
jgi:hypothetical protein